jgi:guanylate kinase
MVESQRPPSGQADRKMAGQSTGHLFIVSAPSGAGKSTLCNAVRRQMGDLAYSVSYTTRSPRQGERDCVDYHFISEADFQRGISTGRWAEWARVHGNYYGSSAKWIEQTLSAGRDILMDIDLQGARQMMQRFPQAVTIFIMPPSLEELEKRLRGRGTDSRQNIDLRLRNAQEEIAQNGICRHVLLNDDIEKATQDLVELIEAYR